VRRARPKPAVAPKLSPRAQQQQQQQQKSPRQEQQQQPQQQQQRSPRQEPQKSPKGVSKPKGAAFSRVISHPKKGVRRRLEPAAAAAANNLPPKREQQQSSGNDDGESASRASQSGSLKKAKNRCNGPSRMSRLAGERRNGRVARRQRVVGRRPTGSAPGWSPTRPYRARRP